MSKVSKIYNTDLEGFEFKIKGKQMCFIICGKPTWITLSDRVAEKINNLIGETLSRKPPKTYNDYDKGDGNEWGIFP